jgi:anti-sigma factor RsiW
MSVTASGDRPTDAELVAYLDGALEPAAHGEVERLLRDDPAARDRLAALAAGGRPLRQVFDGLLEAAPRERLEAMLTDAVARTEPQPRRAAARRGMHWLGQIAAALLLVVVGAAGGYFAAGGPAPGLIADLVDFDSSDAWRDTVAQQVSLYAGDSVAALPVNEAAQTVALARLSAALDMALSPQGTALPGLALKRVDLLQSRDRPLAQLLYYAADTGPVALCIMREEEADRGPTVERRAGLNLVYWTAGGRAFLLLGSAQAAQLRALADDIRNRQSL